MHHKTTVMLLCSILIAISFSGCAKEPPLEAKIVYVPQKCIIPAVEEPVIDNNSYTNSKDIVAKAILNYEVMKEYADKLLTSQEVCK
jgi:hypothetical protein